MRKMSKKLMNKKRWLCLLLCGIFLLSMLGCRQTTREHAQEESIPSEPMLVFYEEDAGNVLTNYQVAYPDVELKIYEIESNQDGLKNGIEKHGEPDLILAGGAGSTYLEDWYEQGMIADINELYLNDDSLNPNDYFTGTFEVCRTEKGLLGLPLAISMRFATLREENYVGTAFENLKEGYTGEDLLGAIEKELEKPRGEDTFFSVESFGSPIEILYCLGAIEKEKEKVKEVMNRIGFMYRFDPILVEADSIYGRYYKAGITDYKGCYQEIMQLLNPESEEWQIESQNLTEGEKADSSIPETEVDEEERKELQERLKSAEIGDEVLLGRYEQDNNLENGSEEIEWIVLDKQDGKMLLLSKYCLDAMAYKDGDRFESLKRSNWLESTIYKWLHSEFMEKGFGVEEQSIIMVSTIPIKIKVDKSESPENIFGIVTDGTAESRLFLLSQEELEKYLPEKEQRKAKATAYAMRDKKPINEESSDIQWWLRTKTNPVFNIKVDENGDTQSIFNILGGIGVRPAMWVDIG